MAKTLQFGLAAVLMSAGVALAVPAYAAASKADSTKETAATGTVDLQTHLDQGGRAEGQEARLGRRERAQDYGGAQQAGHGGPDDAGQQSSWNRAARSSRHPAESEPKIPSSNG
jgi:hypothetical protein